MPVKILIADDNPDSLEALALLLESHGHKVRCVADGRAAIAGADEFEPDACVLDQDMPFMTGVQAAERLRATFGPQLLMICVTGNGRGGRACDDFDFWFTKPYEIATVLDALACSRAAEP